MNYKVNKNTVLVEICGEYFLVSAIGEHNNCPYIRRINENAAFIWKQLVKGLSEDEIEKEIVSAYEIDESTDPLSVIREFIKMLEEQGYLFRVI